MRTTLAAALAVLCLSVCGCTQLPKPDLNGGYLFWTPEEQLVGYRNLEKIFPTRTIRRGREVYPLPKGEPLAVRYEVQGEPWDVARYMTATNAAGVLVIHDGMVVLERYNLGYGPGQRWTSFSVAKSMSSTLAGAALKDGAIKSLEDPITDYLPDLRGSAYEGVTVRQLLTMTSGVQWNEDYGDPNSDVGRIRSARSEDGSDPLIAYMARLPRAAPPGTRFLYSTGETHLVGALVRAAVGKPLAEYLSEKVWAPLGMEKDAVWMLDATGREYAGCCISATLRDFGRFGLFFLEGAKIDGNSIVPDGWIKEATTSTEAGRRANGSGYGYQWWTSPGAAFYATGIFGQHIHINPELKLVVVIQSAWPSATDRTGSAARAAFIAAVERAVRGG